MTKTTEKEKTRGYGTYDNPRQNKKTHTQHKTHRRNAAMETTTVASRKCTPKAKEILDTRTTARTTCYTSRKFRKYLDLTSTEVACTIHRMGVVL